MPSLGERLRESRRRAFVGREAEIALFREVLGSAGVLFLHGPGGTGKSTLLDAFAQVAVDAGRTPTRVDARHLPVGPEPLPVPADDETPVMLIDTYERLEPIDDWVRDEYLPSLPRDSVVVIAGRHAPGPRWWADPAWRDLMRVRPLGNLPVDAGRAHLVAQRVPEPMHDRLLAISRGHPLTLAMLIDAVRRGAAPRTLGDLPEVVGALLAQIVDEAPSLRHRAALEACAHVPVTTEDLLSTLLDDDAGDLFGWLRTLPFVVESRHGLFPHDVVRDAIDTDLRWRAPQRYADLYRRKLLAFLGQVRAAPSERESLNLLVDTILLNGVRSGVSTLRALPPALGAYADELRDDDRSDVVAMTATWQGERQAELVAHWLDRRPESFRGFRTVSGRLRGYTACLSPTADDLGADPVVDAMWRYAERHGPLRPGERMHAWRFFLDREHGQQPSPSMTLFLASQMLGIIRLPGAVAWSLVGAFDEAEWWRAGMEFLDFWAVDQDGPGGGSPIRMFAHDWRRAGPAAWAERLHARQMGKPVAPSAQDLEIPVLTRPEFADAVRSALRHLHEPDRLRANPLLRARLVRDREETGRTAAETLRQVLVAGAGRLPPDLSELVTLTFLRPATTQERVAQTLHLSFNTYRRHRDKAVALLADGLWDREIDVPATA
ncbi:ATP-binding protein [Actinoplanes sp. NPDC020271]|uniref:ATP-binding protein n=1 Tax=Actinoplanes sp. NPDC020271 TaxID=3363896 RepID=UPI00378F6D21